MPAWAGWSLPVSAVSLLLRPAETASLGGSALLAAAPAFAATAASLSGPGWGGSGRSRALLSRLVRRWKGMTRDLQMHTSAGLGRVTSASRAQQHGQS